MKNATILILLILFYNVTYSQSIEDTKEWLNHQLNEKYESNVIYDTISDINHKEVTYEQMLNKYKPLKCEEFYYFFTNKFLTINVSNCLNGGEYKYSIYIIDLSKVTYVKADNEKKNIEIFSKYIYSKKNTNDYDAFYFLDIANGKFKPKVFGDSFSFKISSDNNDILKENLNDRVTKALIHLSKMYGSKVTDENLF